MAPLVTGFDVYRSNCPNRTAFVTGNAAKITVRVTTYRYEPVTLTRGALGAKNAAGAPLPP